MARRITPLSKMDPAARAKRVAQLVGNPNTRAAVPDKYLSGGMLKQRQAAQAAKTPVVPGSSLTNGQLGQQASAATTVRYGDAANQTKQQIAQARQTEADTNGWYQDYLQKLAAHQGNVQAIGAQTTDAIRSLAQAAPVQGPDGTNTPDAQNAAAIRAAILGSSGAAQSTIAGNATRYADTLANVVGPGQKLSALAQARGNTTKAQDALKALMGQEGAYRDQFIAQGKADEAKNVLATQALSNTQTNQAANIDIRRGVDPVTGKRLPSKPGNPYSSGAFAGYTPAEVRKMSPGRKDQLKSDYQKSKSKGTGKSGGKGPSWQGGAAQSNAQTAVTKAISYAKSLQGRYTRGQAATALTTEQKGQPVYTTVQTKDSSGKVTGTKQVRKLNPDGTPVTTGSWDPISSALASAALDMVYNNPPHLSPYTVRKLIAAGIKPSSLGLPTRRNMGKPQPTVSRGGQQAVNDAIGTVNQVASALGNTGR